MKKILDIISMIPLFSGLRGDQLQQIQHIAVERRLAKGERIFSEGDAAEGFFVVVEGLVKIYKLSSEGKEQILHLFGPGEPFGEVPVFSGLAFPANADGLISGRLLYFPKSAFVELITTNPSLALNMLGVMSLRLRQFTVQIESLSLKEVPGRLAAYLIFLAGDQKKKHKVELTIPKGQLASLLGTIPETLSRIFAKMAAQGLISVEGRTIKILDPEGLNLLAEQGKMTE